MGPLQFGGLFDGYYDFNGNHPDAGKNNLRNFDLAAGSFDLSMAKFSVELAPGPVGFRLDAGGGRAFDLIQLIARIRVLFRSNLNTRSAKLLLNPSGPWRIYFLQAGVVLCIRIVWCFGAS